jgi:hypothetical protein
MQRSYYRSGGRRKKKKIIKSDLELLNYSLEDLKRIILKTTKKLKCEKCQRELDVESLSLSLDPFTTLHNTIKSGPHGIYYKCMGCPSNISIIVKIDINEDPEIKKINQDIEDFKNSLRILKNNNKLLLKRLKEDNDRHFEIQNKKNKIDNEEKLELKAVRSKMNKLVYKWEKFSGERGLFSHMFEHFTGIKPDYVDLYIGDERVSVKNENLKEFEKLKKEETNIKNKHIGAYVSMLNKKELIKIDDYNVHRGIPKYFVSGLRETETDIEHLHSQWGYPDFTNLKDSERVDDQFLKPLLEKKNKRILLLRKIFRQTSGCIYILENDEMPGLYKVGWTERSPEERAKELSGTGLPTPYKVAYSKSTNLTADIEKTIHKNLDYCRLRSNREFFKADFSEIKKVVDGTLKEYG